MILKFHPLYARNGVARAGLGKVDAGAQLGGVALKASWEIGTKSHLMKLTFRMFYQIKRAEIGSYIILK